MAFVLLGGSTLGEWVNHRLLRNIGIPAFHIYDSDVEKYEESVDSVNARDNKDSARQTKKLELENYLHPDAIQRVLSEHAGGLGKISFGPTDDVEKIVAAAMPDDAGRPRKKLKHKSLKHWLNRQVASAMTAEQFRAQDPEAEILTWLQDITKLARHS